MVRAVRETLSLASVGAFVWMVWSVAAMAG
nr:cell division inhibitor SidA [Brevundimonas aveniformis]